LINIKKNIGVISMAFIGLLLVLGVNYYNVGIDYDTWIERGMPEWGEYTTCPSPMNRRKGFDTIPATDTDHPPNPHHHSPVPCGREITNKKPPCSLGFLLGCSLVRPAIHPSLASGFLSPCKRYFFLGCHPAKNAP
jgi:hypothetical protein